ncbi:MAG: flagellar export protein FliJ [Clostridiaceae bacterium]|jgi:flagellar FliJ protein|nr:flagellar export protein FliJ [Clostridiaceae bacterium]
MAAYKFRLQKLFDYKIDIEEEKKNKLGLAIKRLENEKHKLSELKHKLNDMQNAFQEKTSQGISVNKLKILAKYIDYYKRGIKEQKVRIKMAEDYLSLCREELIKATQEKKMMEKLREIDYGKYLYEEQKKEEKLVDDLVSFKESNKS